MIEITRNLVDFYVIWQKSIMERLENSQIKNLASVNLGWKSTKKWQRLNREILMTDDRDNDRNNQERASWELRQKASSYNYYPPPSHSNSNKRPLPPHPISPHTHSPLTEWTDAFETVNQPAYCEQMLVTSTTY